MLLCVDRAVIDDGWTGDEGVDATITASGGMPLPAVVSEVEDADEEVEAPTAASRSFSPVFTHPGMLSQEARAPLSLIPANSPQPQPGLAERREFERRLEEQYRQQQQLHQLVPTPILPAVVFMKTADAYTRIRYAVDILTINGEKYLRLDDTHFLCAVNADYLLTGENVTIRRAPYRHWQPDRRAGRPQILFMVYPIGEYAYSVENNRRKKAPQEFRPQLDNFGRILLNAFDRPLKFSNVMPSPISTEIEGWEMEAICRLDPDICHQDFIDRMLPHPGGGKSRPSKGTLNHRRRRDRMKMRILPWPLPRQLSYSDQQVVKELDEWQLAENTTMGLRDLSKEEIETQEAIMYGGHFERSGKSNALGDQVRLEQMRVNLGRVRGRFDEGSEEVRMVKGRIKWLLGKMGREYDAAVWDAGVGDL